MKRLFQNVGMNRMTIMGLFAMAILFTACSKNDNDNVEVPSSGLMLFNLAPDKPSVGFTISGNQIGNVALGFTNYSGTYLPIYAATRELRSFDLNNGSTIASSTENFQDSSYYSAFLIGNAGVYRNVVVKDDYSTVTPVAGKAWVRYINAIPDTISRPDVTIAGVTEGAVFGTVSAFKQVNAGAVSVSISSGAFNANRSITLAENKIYTVLFVGLPSGTTDPNLAAQVKFIENGTASN